jgi:hypothetical protein
MTKTAGSWVEVIRSRDLALIFSARVAMSTSRAIAGIAVPKKKSNYKNKNKRKKIKINKKRG